MTKGELRAARKAARAAGRPLNGALAVNERSEQEPSADAFGESYKGRKALDRRARACYETEGRNDGDA